MSSFATITSIVLFAAAPAVLVGCQSPGDSAATASADAERRAAADARPGVAHLTEEGSFASGKKWTTYQEFERRDRAEVIDRVVAFLTADGWQILEVDKAKGVVGAAGASKDESGKEGRKTRIDAVVTETASGATRIDLAFRTLANQRAATTDVRNCFCNLLDAVRADRR